MTLPDEYMAAPGHNAADGAMTIIDPEPRNDSDIQYPEFVFGSDGSTEPVGERFVDIVWADSLTYEEYVAVLPLFGLSIAVFSAETTVNLRLDDNSFQKFNGTASHQTGKTRGEVGGWWERFTVHIGILEEI